MQIDGLIFFVVAIAAGYFFTKWKLVPSSAADVLPPVLLNVFFPTLLFTSFSSLDATELAQMGLSTSISTFVFSLLTLGGCFLFLRKLDFQKQRLLRFISGIGNTSFVCVPLLSLFLSKSQMAIVFIHGAVMDFLIWGIHHQLYRGVGRDLKTTLKRIFTSPCLIAVFAGILCSAFHVNIPSYVQYPLQMMSEAVSPLSLVFIGILIANYGLLSWCRDKTAIAYTLWKVLVLPAIVFVSLYFLLPLETVVILTLLFGSPGPISSVVWSKQYGGDAKLAVNCLIPSTLLYFLLAGTALFLLSNAHILGA